VSPFWRLELLGGSYMLGKFVHPWIKFDIYLKGRVFKCYRMLCGGEVLLELGGDMKLKELWKIKQIMLHVLKTL
jgi:hypothetical protein